MPQNTEPIKLPPKGLAILAVIGPAFVWCAEYIGSGEVILATRTGAILGTEVMWAIVVGIVLKYWIGMSGVRYTVCTGEGMIDMFSRMPGPKNWAVWIVVIAQFASATISIGSLAAAAGVFVNSLVPISSYFGGWLVTIFAVAVVWTGIFDLLKMVMSFCVFLIVLGVLFVALSVLPSFSTFMQGLGLQVPGVPEWALAAGVLRPNQLAPEGEAVALTLSTIFSSRWGELGGFLFLLAGAAALISTQIGQLAGWPRLLADAFRICIPAFQKKFAWKTQYRLFLLFFLCTNMILVYSFGLKPVFMVKLGALLDGLLLTPLQTLCLIIGLYVVMPRMLSSEARAVLRPHWIFAAGLFIAFIVFGYFCVVQMPFVF